MKKFLFLDFDNTMMATEQFAVPSLIARFNALYAKRLAAPLTAEDFRAHFHGQAREALCESLSKHFGFTVDFKTLYENREAQVMAHFKSLPQGVPMAPHLIEALTDLKTQGVTLSFASNNSVERALAAMRFADNGRGDELAALFGTRFFEAGEAQKPKPDVYVRAMAQTGATPDVSAAVEDSVAGVKSAVAAGLRVFGYTGFAPDAQTRAQELRACGCVCTFNDWADFAGECAFP